MTGKKRMSSVSFRFWAFFGALAVVICAGTVGFSAVEGFSLADSFYFSVVTITTVGFGDLHPVTDMVLSRREMLQRLEKLNMVIGAFYSEVGNRLLVDFSDCDPKLEEIRQDLLAATKCPDEDFQRISTSLRRHEHAVDIRRVDLGRLRGVLAGKRGFMLRLVENPTLLEHESFTDLLMAVFHLTEELIHREKLGDLPESDMVHLAGDIKRVYGMLVNQWLDYMRYLKTNYPYLFSLAMRTNPFDEEATPVVR
jgi:hypothetical protein